jgi:hypothetical protein
MSHGRFARRKPSAVARSKLHYRQPRRKLREREPVRSKRRPTLHRDRTSEIVHRPGLNSRDIAIVQRKRLSQNL